MLNKVMYLTSAMDNESLKEFLKYCRNAPNLSNQNFHNKLIHAIAGEVDVDVISYRPLGMTFKKFELPAQVIKENNIHWKYLYCSKSKFYKATHMYKDIKKITLFDSKVIMVDTLNLSLLKKAIKIRKKSGAKIIGICTDNPFNISFVNRSYKKRLLKFGRRLDGYIVLTEKINELFNVESKPFIQIDGVSDAFLNFAERLLPEDSKYIYFGGSMMKEYGVYQLIRAFNKIDDPDLKLVLCGHHVNKKELKAMIDGNERIRFFGAVDYYNNLALEKYSVLTVNPRPQNPKIDDYSVPSKTLEFLSNSCLTVAVDNPILRRHYDDCIIWAKSGSEEDLKEAIERALSLKEEEKQKIIELGNKKVMEFTSLVHVGESIKYLLDKFFFN